MSDEMRSGAIPRAMMAHPEMRLDITRVRINRMNMMRLLIVANCCNSTLAYTEPDLIRRYRLTPITSRNIAKATNI
jgi:hypothetical protein